MRANKSKPSDLRRGLVLAFKLLAESDWTTTAAESHARDALAA
jgi:hypothetical protein